MRYKKILIFLAFIIQVKFFSSKKNNNSLNKISQNREKHSKEKEINYSKKNKVKDVNKKY